MSKKQAIPYQPAIENKWVEEIVIREIKASPRSIFPLACPVEELRWIPDWKYQLVYSKSGVNETGCIFTEDVSGPHFFEKQLVTTWVTNLHDSEKNCILFQLNIAEKAVIRLQINIREVGKRVSRCTWHMVFTGLDQEANALETESIRAKMNLALVFLSEALKHYCETGRMLE